MISTDRTKELFSSLIQRPTLTDQLLQRPPFKFIHDIVHETLRVTGYLDGLFTSDELDSTKAGSSRDSKLAFLQKLIDALNMDGHLDDVKPSKIVAGKEAEMTNLLLQSLATDAEMYVKEKKKSSTAVEKKNSKSTSSSKNKDDEKKKISSKKDRDKDKEGRSSLKHRPKEKDMSSSGKTAKATGDHQDHEKRKNRDGTKSSNESEKQPSTDKERRKRRSDSSISRHKSSSVLKNNNTGFMDQQQQSDKIYSEDLRQETRSTPVRESSGGTSKGGDDSGIAEEMSAESERHDFDKYGSTVIGHSSTSDFVEVHPSISSPTPVLTASHGIRPGTALARPQTAIGRPGTAVARMAPPKPKKNVISTANNNNAAEEQIPSTDMQQQKQLILEENVGKQEAANEENFLIAEDEDEQLLLGISEGANVSSLRQGDEHGILVNKIVENTRVLQEKHLQEDGPFVEADEPDLQEQRRFRVEIESMQRILQRATQNIQPLVRTMEFVSDDFDAMLRELEDCRKQSIVLERKLQERSTGVSAEIVALRATLRAMDIDIRDVREQLAHSSANVLENERKIISLLEADHQYAKK